MIPLIFVFKSKINVCSESKNFEFFQFQKYDETLESRKLSQRNYAFKFAISYSNLWSSIDKNSTHGLHTGAVLNQYRANARHKSLSRLLASIWLHTGAVLNQYRANARHKSLSRLLTSIWFHTGSILYQYNTVVKIRHKSDFSAWVGVFS